MAAEHQDLFGELDDALVQADKAEEALEIAELRHNGAKTRAGRFVTGVLVGYRQRAAYYSFTYADELDEQLVRLSSRDTLEGYSQKYS